MKQRTAKYNPVEKEELYQVLNREVRKTLACKKNNRYADRGMKWKIAFCLALFAISYSQYLNPHYSWSQWLGWCLLLGVSSMLLGVNIAHDAIHGALFRKKWKNTLAGFSFDLIGISSYSWKLKHNVIHHRFPNVTGVDFDIEAGPFLRLSPAEKHRWFHRFQHIYAPLVYCLFSLHMLLVTDLVLWRQKREELDGKKHPRFLGLVLLLQKSVYILMMVILPAFVLPFTIREVLAGFLLMHFSLSLLLALILLPSHLFEHTSFDARNAAGEIQKDWARHQIDTTLDFAAQNRLVHFLFGGFNTNVVHHLFPQVCHCHYRQLSKIIDERSSELRIAYHHTTLASAIASHFRALKKLGNRDIKEATWLN